MSGTTEVDIKSGGSPFSQWFKVVFVGDARVGKTSLIKAVKCEEQSKEYRPTRGAWITHYDLTERCRLHITDTSGKQEFKELIDLYLRNLHCVVFVFALDDPTSFKRLNHWHQVFTQACTGDPSNVVKFVVGTKTDAPRESLTLQREAMLFAEKIGAEMWITSAAKSFNVFELFARIAENVSRQMSNSSYVELLPRESDFPDGEAGDLYANMLDDVIIGSGALVSYPDPVLLDTNGEEISDLILSHHCVTMIGQSRTFKWGTWSNQRSKEAVMKESPGTLRKPANKLWSCAMANAPPSTWQHESLEGVIKFGTTIRRQPTKTEFKNIKKLLFTSRDHLGWERNRGLFYMMLHTEEDSVLEVGLHSVFDQQSRTSSAESVVVENNFHFKPTRICGQAASVSLSCTHSAVVAGDANGVSTWGHGDCGALGLDEYLIANFSPPSPIAVTSISCQVKQVACGGDFTLILTTEGLVYSCGAGAFGKLGHGDEQDKRLPCLIEALWNMKAIAAAGDHAAAITNRGFLYQWGMECADEQLTQFVSTPTRVGQIDNITVTSLSCGTHHTVLVGNGRWYTGIPYSWGRGSYGRLGVGHSRSLFSPGCVNELYYNSGKVITQVSAGNRHTAFLTKDGEVYTCGNNAFGQLGYLTASGYSDVPRIVCLGKNATGDEIRAKELFCNDNYTMVLTKDDDVLVWGACYYGSKLEDPIPFDVNDKTSLRITDITTCRVLAGETFFELVVALTDDSNLLFCAGLKSDSYCQAADDSTPPIPCNKTNLKTLCSVESVLVSVDQEGNVYYTDIGSWISRFLPSFPTGHNSPEDFIQGLFCQMREYSDSSSPQPVEFTAITSFNESTVAVVEASLSSFLFCSNIGDVFSWSPLVGGHLVRHKELNSEIIVQIACGASHYAALSDKGILFTCGEGHSGQLGNGSFRSIEAFQPVPLTEFDRVQNVFCGWASTSVITETGKVYFWGQLDLRRGEKIRRKETNVRSPTTRFDLVQPQLNQDNTYSLGPVEYQVKESRDTWGTEHQVAIVGKPFFINILPRDPDKTESGSRMEFRVVASKFHDPSQLHTKGRITECQTIERAFVASIYFHSEGPFNVHITRNGRNVLGSPFKVTLEKGVMVKRSKLSLIGSDIDCMTVVEDVLQEAIDFKKSEIELWGIIPTITTDLLTQEALMLASMTDSGTYIYVWDASCGSLAEENLKFWLHQLSVYAPSASVILLGVNLSTTYANKIDLKPFQMVNPQLRQSIFAGTTFTSEPVKLLEEVLLVAGGTITCLNPVWHRFESLASKVIEKRESGVGFLDETTFKGLAGECGIHGDFLCKEAVEHLEMSGIVLAVREGPFFTVLKPVWLARHLTEIAKTSQSGSLDRNLVDIPKQHVINFLIRRHLALEHLDKKTVDIIPYLSSVPEESWLLVDKSKYTTFRHLVLSVPPYHLYSMFQNLAACILQKYASVSLGKYTLVSYSGQFHFRLDCGPCIVNRSVAEVRVTVRAPGQSICTKATEEVLSFLQNCIKGLDHSYEFTVKVSCSVCRQYYVDLIEVQEAAGQGETERACGRCHGNQMSFSNLLNGFTECRPAPEFDWRTLHRAPDPGSPYSKNDILSADTLLRPLIRYIGDREDRQEAKLLREIKGMFENMTKAFVDMKNYDTPRTVCILPEMQTASAAKPSGLERLLTYGKPKFRLFLLCEGNGDGTGVHFLDYSRHKGYILETPLAAAFNKDCVELLRSTFQILLSIGAVYAFGVGVGLFALNDVQKTLTNLLGINKTSSAVLCTIHWNDIFKEMDEFLKKVHDGSSPMDGFLKEVQDSSSSIETPPDAGRGCQLGGKNYERLRKLLSELGPEDDFGGLRQEPRDGQGAIWVCEKHRKYSKETRNVEVMK